MKYKVGDLIEYADLDQEEENTLYIVLEVGEFYRLYSPEESIDVKLASYYVENEKIMRKVV